MTSLCAGPNGRCLVSLLRAAPKGQRPTVSRAIDDFSRWMSSSSSNPMGRICRGCGVGAWRRAAARQPPRTAHRVARRGSRRRPGRIRAVRAPDGRTPWPTARATRCGSEGRALRRPATLLGGRDRARAPRAGEQHGNLFATPRRCFDGDLHLRQVQRARRGRDEDEVGDVDGRRHDLEVGGRSVDDDRRRRRQHELRGRLGHHRHRERTAGRRGPARPLGSGRLRVGVDHRAGAARRRSEGCARNTAVVVLPTPPLRLATVTIITAA